MATRKSTESDRRHLLQPSRPASIFSVMTGDGDDDALPQRYATADDRAIPSNNPSLLSIGPSAGPPIHKRSQSVPEIPRPYRGFPSEQDYLNALKQWAEGRMYFETKYQLTGWYGTKTIDEYLEQPVAFPSRKGKARREREKAEKKKAAESRLPGVTEEVNDEVPTPQQATQITEEPLERTSTRTRVKSLSQRVFRRRGTIA